MQALTFLVSGILSVWIIVSPPMTALLVFLGGLIWYPQYLTLSVGTIDFTLGRILIIVLAANVVFRSNLYQKFKWQFIDTLMMVYFIARLIALTFNVPLRVIVEHEGGFFLDVIVPYYIARMVIVTKSDFLRMIRLLVIMAIPLAFIGMFQSLTGVNLMSFFRSSYAWGFTQDIGAVYPQRYGLYRASAHFGIHILFGLFFACIIPLVVNMMGKKYHWGLGKTIVAAGILGMGAFSSVSSMPLFTIVMSVCFFMAYPFRMYWRYMVIGILAFIVFAEFYSNRHWYEIASRFALSGSTSYYRIELIREALGGGMNGHWLAGYGLVGLNTTGIIDPWQLNWHWVNQDLTNTYVSVLANFGLLGLIPLAAILYTVFRKLAIAARYAGSFEDYMLVWSLAAVMFGVCLGITTINILEQPRTLFYMYMGIAASMPLIMRPPEAPRVPETPKRTPHLFRE